MASITRLQSRYFLKKYFNSLKCTNNFRIKHEVLFHVTSLINADGHPINMPSLSPTMSEGTIVKWLKKEGDKISPGDVLCDIQTDKAVMSMDTEEEGILAKILVPEDTKDVKVGTLIALMVEEGEDWKNVILPKSPTDVSRQSASPSQKEDNKTEIGGEVSISGPPTTPLNMPSLSPTMSEGTIVKWLKKEGDKISPGDVLCDIQTDKAVVSMDTEEEGILAKILVPEDTKDVKVGTLIALMVAEGEDWKAVTVTSSGTQEESPTAMSGGSSGSGTQPVSPQSVGQYGPAVRTLLEVYQLDSSQITGSGRNNKILKEDVLKYIADNKLERKPPKSAAPPVVASKQTKMEQTTSKEQGGAEQAWGVERTKSGAKYTDKPLTTMRQVIAKRLSQSKREIPHSYGNIKCNIDKLLEVRQSLVSDGVKVSVNDFVIRAVASALEECPQINILYQNNEVRRVDEIDISIAVATDNGLITPIIRSANKKSVVDISGDVKELSGRARSNKLKPEEFQGGTFTISNLGMFGIKEFSAIINPPQCGILAVGGGIQSISTNLKPRTDMIVTLSYDRRAVEEHEAARFLESLRNIIENPNRIVLGKTGCVQSSYGL